MAQHCAARLLLSVAIPSCALELQLAPPARARWITMCEEEGTSTSAMLERWVATRWDMVDEARSHHQPSKAGDAVNSGVLQFASCPHATLNVETPSGAWELFGFAETELECTAQFLRAVAVYGRHLLREKLLGEFDIMHEVIRAETGYRLAKINGRQVERSAFDDFMEFQAELASALQGWALWEYEFKHWRYYKRPTANDEQSHLYNSLRPPEFQHVECPAIPLAYRMWGNFPTCAPTRLMDVPRFTDAYVSGMTVDNWRAGYREFLSEEHKPNVSFFAGGDPTWRLSKGAHSVFAGVFIQKFPTDLMCYQQVIHDCQPRYIIELGTSQGGSAVWFASVMKMLELPGKVITIDMSQDQAYWLSKSRAEDAAQRLKLEDRIDWNYVDGGSKNKDVRKKVKRLCDSAPCMVVSDSDHDYAHTYPEIDWYSRLVGVGQYLVVEDTSIYGWSGFLNINDPNVDGLKKGPMEAANDFELKHRADYVRTDWCAKHYGLSQTPNGWFFRKALRAKGIS